MPSLPRHRFAFVITVASALLVSATTVKLQAGDTASMGEHADAMWQIIGVLVAALNTVLTGIALWLIKNQSELFSRMRHIEAAQQTADRLCEERHAGGRRYYDPTERPNR